MIQKFKIGDRVVVKTGASFNAGTKGIIVSIGYGAFDYGIRRDNATYKVGYNEGELELLEEGETASPVKHLFHWSSEALARYSDGKIIVMASSVSEARDMATKAYELYLRSDDSSLSWLFKEDGSCFDEEAQEDYDNVMKKFKQDIASEPTIIDSGVVFVRGSE